MTFGPSGLRQTFLAGFGVAILVTGCQDTTDLTRRPVERQNEAGQQSITTKVFVASQINDDTLREQLAGLLPENISTVKLWVKKAACAKYRGRRRCASAHFVGSIRRDGPLSVAALGKDLRVMVPLRYEMTATGSRHAEKLKQTTSGRLTLSALYEIALDKDMKPSVRYLNSYRWQGDTEVKLLNGKVSIARAITRKVRTRLRSFASMIANDLETRSATDILAKAWRTLHYPVELSAKDNLWLRGEPMSVGFAGMKSDSGVLEVRFGIDTRLKSFIGARPMPLIPIAMPDLAREVAGDARSHFLMPVRLDYDVIKGRLAKILPAGSVIKAERNGEELLFTVKGAEIFPSLGRLALAVSLEADLPDRWRSLSGTAYLVGSLKVRGSDGVLSLASAKFTAPTASPSLFADGKFLLPQQPFREAFERAVKIDLRQAFGSVLQKANKIMNRPLSDDLMLNGVFRSLDVHSIEPQRDGLLVNLDLIGDLTVAHRSEVASQGSVTPTSGTTESN